MRWFEVIAVLLVVCCVGCQSEAERQHHLFYLEKCKAETLKADAVAFQYYPAASGKITRAEAQSDHDYRAINCMAEEEKTSEEFQRQKHDDYGVVRDEDLQASSAVQRH